MVSQELTVFGEDRDGGTNYGSTVLEGGRRRDGTGDGGSLPILFYVTDLLSHRPSAL